MRLHTMLYFTSGENIRCVFLSKCISLYSPKRKINADFIFNKSPTKTSCLSKENNKCKTKY